MATTLFPTSQQGPLTSFQTALTRTLSLARGSGVISQADATVASLVAGANPQTTGTVAMLARAAGSTLAAADTVEASATVGAALFWMSPPLNTVTIAGSITANLRCAESAAQANYGIGCKIYRVHAGTIDAAFAQASTTVEISSGGETAQSITLTPTSTVLATGDSVGAIIFFTGIGTSASGRTATVWYNGTTSAASGDTFLTFTETITAAQPITQPTNFASGAVMARRIARSWRNRLPSGILVPDLWLPGTAVA